MKTFTLKKQFFLTVILCFSLTVTVAQVGINTTTPNTDAILDVTSTATKTGGLLMPRVALTGTGNTAPLSANVAGMTVYNTATAGDVTPGYYYNDGSQWVRIAADTPSNDWSRVGNAGTVAGTNFLGTTDNIPIRFRTNNTNRFEMTTNGRLRSFNSGSQSQPTYSWNNSTSSGMFRAANNQLGLSTDGTERVRVDENGAVGIGTTTPSTSGGVAIDRLNVSGEGTSSGLDFTPVSVIDNTGDGASLAIFNSDNTNDFPVLEVGTESPGGTAIRGLHTDNSNSATGTGIYGSTNSTVSSWAGYFNGDVGVAGTLYTPSDENWKKDISALNTDKNILNKLMLLKPKKYKWRTKEFPGMAFNPNKTSYGFIAQELKEIFPDLVVSKGIPDPKQKIGSFKNNKSVNDYYMVEYMGLIPILTEAIQEQQKKITSLEQRLEAIEKAMANKN